MNEQVVFKQSSKIRSKVFAKMSQISMCTVLNRSSETGIEHIKVCTEWDISKVKIIIIKGDNTFLVGEAPLDDFDIYSKVFDKTLDEYLQEVKETLAGRKEEVEFFLTKDTFYWKKKNCFLGKITIKAVKEIEGLSSFILFLLNDHSRLKHENSDFNNLKTIHSKVCNKLNEIIMSKEQQEIMLYKKFLILLNSKKAKIRELQSKLKKFEPIENSIFNAETDESENEFETKSDIVNNFNCAEKFSNKRLANKNDKVDVKRKKIESETILTLSIASKSSENTQFKTKNDLVDNFNLLEKSLKISLANKNDKIDVINHNKAESEAQLMLSLATKSSGNQPFKTKNDLIDNFNPTEKCFNTSLASKNDKIDVINHNKVESEAQLILSLTTKNRDNVQFETKKDLTDKYNSTEKCINKSLIDKNNKVGLLNDNKVEYEAQLSITSKSSDNMQLTSTIGEDEETPDLSEESECEVSLTLEDNIEDDNIEDDRLYRIETQDSEEIF